MKSSPSLLVITIVCLSASMAAAGPPALTVYNQNFAVVRQTVPLELQPGVNAVSFTETTAHLEPDSVILRDPGGRRLQIIEQNFRADPLSQNLLLSLYEGQTIEFVVAGKDETVAGRIVRSGYVPHRAAWQRYGYQFQMTQSARMYPGGQQEQPIIEVDGKLRFGLPGHPLFPSLAEDTILKPTLHWLLETDAPGQFDAELSYITGGMSWKADYNVVAPVEGDVLELVGWVTVDNQSGRTFEDARIKLMAGEVNKIEPNVSNWNQRGDRRLYAAFGGEMQPPVSERAFDEYHLYTLHRPTTLRDHETKQVEFIRAAGVASQNLYVYDGLRLNRNQYQGWAVESLRENRDYGTQSGTKVWVMREFDNTEANHLGMPLPAGRVRFYRRGDDGQLEFTGENEIDHTPRDETVRVYTGSAFDLVGRRRRTDFQYKRDEHWLDESFEIKLRNHKTEPVEIRAVEHLYRWHNWEITEKGAKHSIRPISAHDVSPAALMISDRLMTPPRRRSPRWSRHRPARWPPRSRSIPPRALRCRCPCVAGRR